ncbi:MAG TPA: energy transducer TonB [Bryobacteraceae bacterium]
MKLSAAFPAGSSKAFKKQIAGMFPSGIVIRVKGDQCANSFGRLSTIVDNGKGEVTVFNSATKRFATIPLAAYSASVLSQRQLPAVAQRAAEAQLQSMKAKTERTGETALIQGIRAEENLTTLSMQTPNPTGPPNEVRLEMHRWVAAADELIRIPALREMADCGLGTISDPSAATEQFVVGAIQGAHGWGEILKELATVQGQITLKIRVEEFDPASVARMQAGGLGGVQGDANAPLLDVSFMLAELSPEPIPDAAFRVPEGYQAAPLEDLLKDPVTGDFQGVTYRPGGGVSKPKPIYHPQPKYTEDARRARIQGAVLLSVVIDQNGTARNVKVVRSLEPGLDQSAIDTVRQWKFTRGQKDGGPVAVASRIEVTFRLLDKPDQK